jgi:hypothetical protein
MSNQLRSLKKFFKGGSAEEEKDIRGVVFIPPKNIEDLLDFDFHDSTIILGNKGVGKSILINVLHEAYLQNQELSLLISPRDLKCDEILDRNTLADKKSTAYNQILLAIAENIGKYSNENDKATVDRDIIALQQLSIQKGVSKQDMISVFSKILIHAIPKGKEIANAILETQTIPITENNLSELVNSYLDEKNMNLWLLLDDIDEASTQQEGKKGFDYSACWAIISAARELSLDINKLKCIISVRSDIWHLMTTVQNHGSGELDKLGHIYELKFSEQELQEIFNKRIELAAKDIHHGSYNYGTELSIFFENKVVILPGTTGSLRDWNQWLPKLARFRPRDLIKAVQELIKEAKKDKVDKISSRQAHAILLQFSKDRVDNIFNEYKQICPQIKEIMRDFSEKDMYSFKEVIDVITAIPSRRATQLDGISIQAPPTKEQQISILKLLHMACFLNPREDSGDSYSHLNYNDFPDLLTINNYGYLQKYKWQIHPVFHAYTAEERRGKRYR